MTRAQFEDIKRNLELLGKEETFRKGAEWFLANYIGYMKHWAYKAGLKDGGLQIDAAFDALCALGKMVNKSGASVVLQNLPQFFGLLRLLTRRKSFDIMKEDNGVQAINRCAPPTCSTPAFDLDDFEAERGIFAAESETSQDALDWLEICDILRKGGFSENDIEILQLNYRIGFDQNEIAASVGLTPARICQKIKDMVALLRKAYNSKGEDLK